VEKGGCEWIGWLMWVRHAIQRQFHQKS